MKITRRLWKQQMYRGGHSHFVNIFKDENRMSAVSMENSSQNLQFRRMKRRNQQNHLPKHLSFKKDLKLDKSRDFGRYIMTAEQLNVGKTVIVTEPFASVVEKRRNAPYCLTCHKTHKRFICCNKCSMVYFCNLKCRNANLTHRFECGTHFHEIINMDVKCAIQMVFEAMATFHDFNDLHEFVLESVKYRDGIPKATNSRASKLDCILKLKPKEFIDIAGKNYAYETAVEAYNTILTIPEVQNYFGLNNEKANLFLQHFLAHNVSIIIENGFRTTLSVNGREIERILLYDVLSFLNHSCSPNLINYIDGNVTMCVTSQKIQRGEQLFISYQPFDKELKHERQTVLDHWNFKCRCVRCQFSRDINEKEFQKAEKMTKRELERELNQISEWTPQKGAYVLSYACR